MPTTDPRRRIRAPPWQMLTEEPAAPVRRTAVPAQTEEPRLRQKHSAPQRAAPETEEPAEDVSPTFSTDFNLDDLKFGRNYNGEH